MLVSGFIHEGSIKEESKVTNRSVLVLLPVHGNITLRLLVQIKLYGSSLQKNVNKFKDYHEIIRRNFQTVRDLRRLATDGLCQ
jgi:hypothetical protein